MLNFNSMEKTKGAPKPLKEDAEMEVFFKKLEKDLKDVPEDVLASGAQKIQDFLEGKVGWAEVFQFQPEQVYQMAEMGYNHFKAGRYQDAERFFKVLTVLDWENYYYHSMMGSILQNQDRDGEAIIEYSQAIESNPEDIVSHANRGEIFMRHGWVQDAARDFEKAVTLDPKGENEWALRARVLLEQIKKQEARKKKKEE